jgi:hypothetical protein
MLLVKVARRCWREKQQRRRVDEEQHRRVLAKGSKEECLKDRENTCYRYVGLINLRLNRR